MTTFETVEQKRHHIGRIAHHLSRSHARAIAEIGEEAHPMLLNCHRSSIYRKTWLINGKPEAIGGIISTMASAYGLVWLAFTEESTKYPVALVKEILKQREIVMAFKREIATTILANDPEGQRFAVAMGFHVSHDGGPGERATSRQAARELIKYLQTDGAHRIPVNGRGHVIAMGYHED